MSIIRNRLLQLRNSLAITAVAALAANRKLPLSSFNWCEG
jgi:hypothetical protein